MTKIELTQVNSRLATENAALRAKCAGLEAEIKFVPGTRVVAMSDARRAEVDARFAVMKRAQVLAQNSGRVVRVADLLTNLGN